MPARITAWLMALGVMLGSAQEELDWGLAPLADGVRASERLVSLSPFETRLWREAPAAVVYLPPTKVPPSDWEGYKHPFWVAGYVAPAPPDLWRSGRWTPFQHGDISGRLGVLHLRSQGAKALRLCLKKGKWHPRAELRVFDPQVEVAFGPIRPEWDD
ncbi:MAG: hypothetical protein SNJ72_07670, partial [Fimbriimonadales bacterium]